MEDRREPGPTRMSEDLFYENLIADYVGVDGYVRRDWLEGAVI